MQKESRVYKSLLNARISLLFYFISIAISFFSRKIFLENLGAEFMGLGGTISEILGFLSLAELGIATATSYNLYKPLQQGDKKRIEELVSVIGYLYRKIGCFVIIAGIVISMFIPLIFGKTPFDLGLLFFGFYCVLFSSACTYLINYRQIILSADQKNYIVTGYLQTAGIIKVLLQIAAAYYWHNYYIWFALDLVFAIIGCVILNKRIDKTYPWLKASVKKGRIAFPNNKELLNSTRQVFVHKIKDFLLTRTDQVMIFAFVSLKMVAFYGNYTIVISRISTLFSSVLDSFTAGVGNLVAEGDKRNQLKVFWEISSIRYFVGGTLVFGVYCFIEPFISLWLGKEYILDRWILVLLMTNTFIIQTRGAVDMFNHAFGHYGDIWAAWVEGAINISVTLISAPFIGICGILLGKFVSMLIIIVLWKPIYLFRDGFKISILFYWRKVIRYYIALSFAVGSGLWIKYTVPIQEESSFFNLILKSTLCITLFCLLYIISMYLIAPGSKDLIKRVRLLVYNRTCK